MPSSSVAIIDYGMGNLHSVASAVNRVAPQAQVQITADSKQILNADRVIFPGVGAMRDCMAALRATTMDQSVIAALSAGQPMLAICVGMQAMLEFSEENDGVDCLGVLPGRVKRFPAGATDASGSRIKVPHMGWNQVTQTSDHPLWQGVAQNSYFYFVHSYYVDAADPQQVAGRCHYALDFHAALQHKNLFAVQFHPEKSHKDGLRLLKNFINWNGSV